MLVISPQFQAQNILRLSKKMYQHAQEGDWTAFGELEITRQNMIDALFADPHIDTKLEQLASSLRQVMSIDSKSIALGEKEKQQLGQDMLGLKQHRQAAQVYQLVSMN